MICNGRMVWEMTRAHHVCTDVKELIVPSHLHFRTELRRGVRRNVHELLRPLHLVPEGFVQVAVDGDGGRRSRRRAVGDVLPRVDGVIRTGRAGVGGHHIVGARDGGA